MSIRIYRALFAVVLLLTPVLSTCNKVPSANTPTSTNPFVASPSPGETAPAVDTKGKGPTQPMSSQEDMSNTLVLLAVDDSLSMSDCDPGLVYARKGMRFLLTLMAQYYQSTDFIRGPATAPSVQIRQYPDNLPIGANAEKVEASDSSGMAKLIADLQSVNTTNSNKYYFQSLFSDFQQTDWSQYEHVIVILWTDGDFSPSPYYEGDIDEYKNQHHLDAKTSFDKIPKKVDLNVVLSCSDMLEQNDLPDFDWWKARNSDWIDSREGQHLLLNTRDDFSWLKSLYSTSWFLSLFPLIRSEQDWSAAYVRNEGNWVNLAATDPNESNIPDSLCGTSYGSDCVNFSPSGNTSGYRAGAISFEDSTFISTLFLDGSKQESRNSLPGSSSWENAVFPLNSCDPHRLALKTDQSSRATIFYWAYVDASFKINVKFNNQSLTFGPSGEENQQIAAVISAQNGSQKVDLRRIASCYQASLWVAGTLITEKPLATQEGQTEATVVWPISEIGAVSQLNQVPPISGLEPQMEVKIRYYGTNRVEGDEASKRARLTLTYIPYILDDGFQACEEQPRSLTSGTLSLPKSDWYYCYVLIRYSDSKFLGNDNPFGSLTILYPEGASNCLAIDPIDIPHDIGGDMKIIVDYPVSESDIWYKIQISKSKITEKCKPQSIKIKMNATSEARDYLFFAAEGDK